MGKMIIRILINTLSLWLAATLVPGFHVQGLGTLLIAALLLGVVNAVVKPVLVFMTLPLTLLTLGLFLLVVNAAMLGLVAWFLPGFTIDGFMPALLGWVILSLVGWVTSKFL